MENRASKNRPINIAFVLTPELLKRLAMILKEASERLEFTVKFADGTSVDYERVDEIIEQPNSDRRSIIGVIAGTAENASPSANIVLKSKFASLEEPSIEYTLSGPQRSVVYLSDQLDDWVAATGQWYSRLFSPVFLIPLVFGALFLPPYLWKYMSHRFALTKGLPPWVGLIVVCTLWAAEVFILKLFPRGTFAIGKGAAHHEFLGSIRWGVIAAFLVSVVASVVANLLTGH
jgi:hypothetical protein